MSVSWIVLALLSAASAGLVGVFGKLGVSRVDSTAATAVRALIMAAAVLGVLAFEGRLGAIGQLWGEHRRALLWIFLSGLAGAASWLFYFAALKLGPASRVAPIDRASVAVTLALAVLFLGERPGWPAYLGTGLILAGTLLVARG